jgi:hypothetical protein
MIASMTAMAVTAFAYPAMLKAFDAHYKVAKNSHLKKADCMICHVDEKASKLNPYGEAVKKALEHHKTKKLTAEILTELEPLDSDGDGVSNGDEIKHDTLPGDPKSHPKK